MSTRSRTTSNRASAPAPATVDASQEAIDKLDESSNEPPESRTTRPSNSVLSESLRLVAEQRESNVIDTDFEREARYRSAIDYVREHLTPRLESAASTRPSARTQKPKALIAPPSEIIEHLTGWMREIVRAEIGRPDDSEWLDQSSSPLGHRRHLSLVRAGVLPGRMDGKKRLVRRRDIDAYLDAHPVAISPPRSSVDGPDAIDAELSALGFEPPCTKR